MLGWFVAGRVLRPIRRITAHARRASSANLDERIDSRGPPDELHELSETFDAMLDRLQTAFQAQRQFAGQVSHELRTPLAIMQAAADVTLADPNATAHERELGLTIRNSVSRSERLIDGLLILSRSESTLLDTTTLDLAEIAGNCLANAARAAGAAGITIDESELAPAPVRGDRLLLERLCDNLIDNAIRYNRTDGSGWLRVSTSVDEDFSELKVANSGSWIMETTIDRLFAPFQRGGRPDIPGYGLGLAIVRSVTAAHGGTIHARPLPGGGLEISVRLPRV
ncbi:MAG TPA: HAMP domain-containing sensor histidine kinase, partial [Thermomicrobiales bacterium]|nr:HAMP domain-containing sensor histidine kinase [Thermomicrobiales bacterium]